MNQFLRMVLHSKYISFYSTVCSSITRSCSMNIKDTASVEAVRLSIEWVDNMAKSKHNIHRSKEKIKMSQIIAYL